MDQFTSQNIPEASQTFSQPKICESDIQNQVAKSSTTGESVDHPYGLNNGEGLYLGMQNSGSSEDNNDKSRTSERCSDPISVSKAFTVTTHVNGGPEEEMTALSEAEEQFSSRDRDALGKRRMEHCREGGKKPRYTDNLEHLRIIISKYMATAPGHMSESVYKPARHVRDKRQTNQKKVDNIHPSLPGCQKFQSETNICENEGCINCHRYKSERTSRLLCKVVSRNIVAFRNISSRQSTSLKRSRLDSEECCIAVPLQDAERANLCEKQQGSCKLHLASESSVKRRRFSSETNTERFETHKMRCIGGKRTYAELSTCLRVLVKKKKRLITMTKQKRLIRRTKQSIRLQALVRKKKGFATKTFHTKHSPPDESPKTSEAKVSYAEAGKSTLDTQVILDRVYIDEAPLIKSTQPPTREEYQFHEPRQVSADTPGRVSDAIGDPPGQQSVYIPPGDVRKEAYRLSTYERFPVACPISRKSLAKSGFYFTGFFDRVKCFACGRTVERWEGEDDPTELRWHKPDCPFPRGEPCGNVPVLELFSRLRLNTQHGQAEQQQRSLNSNQQYTPTGYSGNVAQRGTNSGGIYQTGIGGDFFIQSGTGSRPNQPSHVGNQSAPRHPQRWRMANVISADHRRFLSNLYLNRELDRLTSFARWPMSRPNVSPTALAKSGFFYLGDMDRTQCFSCGGVLRNWTSEDNAQEEHRTHFPSCPMVHGTELRNIPVPEEAETPEQRARLYPCRYSASPHMRSEDARLDTFQHGWQTGRTTATPAEIAQAGFFFLGERDRVKCWYCNGGLQNWEYDDVPWVEHAKWFPNCQFLLQNKGQNYVHHHLSMNPHLARPVIAKQEGATIDPMPSAVRGQDIPPSETRTVTQPAASPAIIDPREEMRKRRERINQILANSDLVKNVLTMGFSEEIVRGLVEERIDAGREANPNDIFGSVSELLDAVMAKEAEEMNVEENNEPSMTTEPSGFASNTPSYGSSLGPPLGSGRYNVSYIGDERMDESEPGSATSMQPQTSVRENDESLEEQLRKMEEERMCKICFTNMADMVYIPCGHMCCCMECTRAINKCPVCRKKIEKALKTYAT